jgi:hypothetical protein
MTGTIKQMIDTIIETRSKGNLALISATKVKLIFKGVNPNDYTPETEDDPQMIRKVHEVARELGVSL